MNGDADIRRNIEKRSYRFAVAATAFCRYHDVEFGASRNLFNQLMRSATSVGANVREAQGGQSRADFLSKMSVAWKEAKESEYWLRLALDTDVFPRCVITSPWRYCGGKNSYDFALYKDPMVIQRRGRQAVVAVGKFDEKLGLSQSRASLGENWKQERSGYESLDVWGSSGGGREVGILTDAWHLWAESSQLVRIVGTIVGKTRRSLESSRGQRRGSTHNSKLQTTNS